MAKKKNNLKYFIIGIIVLLVLVIMANKAGWIGKGETVKVATEKVEIKVVNETVSASGKIQPEIEVKLSSEVSGEIVELTIKEGDIVKQGQLLCRVKPDILQSGYDRAVASLNTQKASLAAAQQQLIQTRANFNNVEANYKRNLELFNKKVISASEFDQIRAEYEGAKANLAMQEQNVLGAKYNIDQSNAMVKEAADNLARTTIYAPIDGVVSVLSVELGERVVGTAQMAGTEIMRIANMSSMEVNVDVNENDINRISVGNESTIEVDAFQGRKFMGVVTEIASSSTAVATTTSADQVTNFMVKVRISPDSYTDIMGDNKLTSPFRPGLSATVDIHTQKDSGLAVPIQAVTTREIKDSLKTTTAANNMDSISNKGSSGSSVKECVFVYKDGKVILKPVKTGIQDDQYIRILDGLEGGEEVVVSPFTAISKTLKDGSLVEKVDRDKLF
jgi:HlyD family secretion protein